MKTKREKKTKKEKKKRAIQYVPFAVRGYFFYSRVKMRVVYVVIENKHLENRYKVINNSKYIALMILRIKMDILKRLY